MCCATTQVVVCLEKRGEKMKKKWLTGIALIVALCSTLSACQKAPDPTIKEGRFDFSVTYEVDGEISTVSSTYVCKLEESGWHLDGWYIHWNAYIEDSEIEALVNDESYYGGILICANEYGNVYLDLSLDAGYLMAEPGKEHREYKPSIFIRYNEETAEKLDTYEEREPAILESYGVKLISYECDAPIENTYK